MNIEVLTSLHKILPNYKPTHGKTVKLIVARNEVASYKVALQSDNRNEVIETINVDCPYGTVDIYVEGFMNVTKQSTIDGLLGIQPDIMIPTTDKFFKQKRNGLPLLLQGRTRSLHVDVLLHSALPSGFYAVKLIINGQVVICNVELRSFAIPIKSSLPTAFPVGYQEITKGHGLGVEHRESLIDVYTQSLFDHRLTNSDLVIFAPVLKADGTVDFTAFDKTISKWVGKLTSFRIKDFNYRPTQIPYAKSVSYYKQYKKHLIDLGIYDISFHYTKDEPQPGDKAAWDEIKLMSKCLHEAGIHKVSVTTSLQNARKEFAEFSIDLFIPTIRFMDNKAIYDGSEQVEPPGGLDTVGNQRSKYSEFLRDQLREDVVWWYQACGSHGCGHIGGGPDDPEKYRLGWPTYMLDMPYLYSRIMSWMTYKYNIQGELYYETVYAYGKTNPWVDINHFSGNGDGTLFYPGTPATIGGTSHIPVESNRLKQIRDGLQDYEYFKLGEKLGLGNFVKSRLDSIVRSTYDFEKDIDKFLRAKLDIGDAIESASVIIVPDEPDPAPVKDEVKLDGILTVNGKQYKIKLEEII